MWVYAVVVYVCVLYIVTNRQEEISGIEIGIVFGDGWWNCSESVDRRGGSPRDIFLVLGMMDGHSRKFGHCSDARARD